MQYEEHDMSPVGDVHMAPPLDQAFKKPLPAKNRRRPSKGHLQHMGLPAYRGESVCIRIDMESSCMLSVERGVPYSARV